MSRQYKRPASAENEARVPANVHAVLRQPGRVMDSTTRTSFEQQLSFDLTKVRVHTDPQAAASAQALRAHAYNVGSHIVFAEGRYSPQTPAGQALLRHELSHVMQRRGAEVPDGPLSLAARDSPHERHAERAARGDTSGRDRGPALPGHMIARAAAADFPVHEAYDSERPDWLLERIRRGHTQIKVYIAEDINDSVGDGAAREVIRDLNSVLAGLGSQVHFVIVTHSGIDTLRIGSEYQGVSHKSTGTLGRSDGPAAPPDNREPFSLVFKVVDNSTGPEFALERGRDSYKNTLMHELLHQLGLGHAYAWEKDARGKHTGKFAYAVDGTRTQMLGDTEKDYQRRKGNDPAANLELLRTLGRPKDTRDAVYRGVPAADRNALRTLLEAAERRKLRAR